MFETRNNCRKTTKNLIKIQLQITKNVQNVTKLWKISSLFSKTNKKWKIRLVTWSVDHFKQKNLLNHRKIVKKMKKKCSKQEINASKQPKFWLKLKKKSRKTHVVTCLGESAPNWSEDKNCTWVGVKAYQRSIPPNLGCLYAFISCSDHFFSIFFTIFLWFSKFFC